MRIVPSRRYWQFLFHHATHTSRPAISEGDRARERSEIRLVLGFSSRISKAGDSFHLFFPLLASLLFSPALNRVRIAFAVIVAFKLIYHADVRVFRVGFQRGSASESRTRHTRDYEIVPSLFLLDVVIKCFAIFRYVVEQKLNNYECAFAVICRRR